MTKRIQINNLDELKSYNFKNGKELLCFLIDEADSFPAPLYPLLDFKNDKELRQFLFEESRHNIHYLEKWCYKGILYEELTRCLWDMGRKEGKTDFECLLDLDLIRLTKNKRQLIYFDLNDFPKSSEYQLYSWDKQDIKENIKKRILISYPELEYYL